MNTHLLNIYMDEIIQDFKEEVDIHASHKIVERHKKIKQTF